MTQGKLQKKIRELLCTTEQYPTVEQDLPIIIIREPDKVLEIVEAAKTKIGSDVQVLINLFATKEFPSHRVASDVQKVLKREILRLKEDFMEQFGR